MSDDLLLIELSRLQRRLVAEAIAHIKRDQLGECWGTDDPDEWRKELQEGDAPAVQQRRAA